MKQYIMDRHGYRPNLNDGSQDPPPDANASAARDAGTGPISQSVYYPTMQHNLPHMSRQMPQYDLYPNFGPNSLAFNHFMYNINQGTQGHFPFDTQMNHLPWGTGLPSTFGHTETHGNKYLGNGISPDIDASAESTIRASSYDTPSPIPHPISSPNVNSFIYPISSYSTSGRMQQKKPRRLSIDTANKNEIPFSDNPIQINELPSFPGAYLPEPNKRLTDSGLGYVNQTSNNSSHSVGTPDVQVTKDDEVQEQIHTNNRVELETGGNFSKNIYHHSEIASGNEDLTSNSDSDDSLSEEDEEEEEDGNLEHVENKSLTFKVEPNSDVSSDSDSSVDEGDNSDEQDHVSVKMEVDSDVTTIDYGAGCPESDLSDHTPDPMPVGDFCLSDHTSDPMPAGDFSLSDRTSDPTPAGDFSLGESSNQASLSVDGNVRKRTLRKSSRGASASPSTSERPTKRVS
jgi:hypothetical protein